MNAGALSIFKLTSIQVNIYNLSVSEATVSLLWYTPIVHSPPKELPHRSATVLSPSDLSTGAVAYGVVCVNVVTSDILFNHW